MSQQSCGRVRCRNRIEDDKADWRPVSDVASPPFWVGATGSFVKLAALREDGVLGAEVTLIRRHIADAAVAMLTVVPGNELRDPAPCSGQIDEGRSRVCRRVLQRTKQGLRVRVIVRNMRATE